MTSQETPRVSFVSYSRWTLKRGSDRGDAVELFKGLVRPAYAQLSGCLELTLLEVVDSRSFLVLAGWDTRDDYDAWVRNSDDWREANAEAFKQWQDAMEFEEEFQASLLFQG